MSLEINKIVDEFQQELSVLIHKTNARLKPVYLERVSLTYAISMSGDITGVIIHTEVKNERENYYKNNN